MTLPPDIDANRMRLLPVLLGLLALVPESGGVLRSVWLGVLVLLRPAESAVRRLVETLAQGIVVPEWAAGSGLSGPVPKGVGGKRVSAFRLFDPRRRVGLVKLRVPGFGPNVRFLDGEDAPVPERVTVSPDDPVDVARLRARLEAALDALDDLPRQARRLARALARPGCRYMRAMRPGRPPGYCAARRHPVDDVLDDCHVFALMALDKPP